MSDLIFNKGKRRNVPIERNNLFFSEEDYQLDIDIGLDYISEDTNQTIVLYQVDLEKTNLDYAYSESGVNKVVTKPPVEIHAVYKIEQAEQKSYANGKGVYMQTGKLTVGLYQQSLDELGVDVKNGDYIGIQVTPQHMEYFTVSNDGRVNYDNKHSIYGYKPGYRTLTCIPTDKTEFSGF